MDILYSREMKKHCRDRGAAVRKWGPEQGKLVIRRIDELKDVSCLADLRRFPALRCHELKGDRKGQIAIDLINPYRLILEPANDPIPRKEDGGLDWEQITAVRLLEVVDYHDS